LINDLLRVDFSADMVISIHSCCSIAVMFTVLFFGFLRKRNYSEVATKRILRGCENKTTFDNVRVNFEQVAVPL
jgi:hypothetical protein